jgi:hypothetical protein
MRNLGRNQVCEVCVRPPLLAFLCRSIKPLIFTKPDSVLPKRCLQLLDRPETLILR